MAEHLQGAAVLFCCKVYGSADFALLGDCVALDAVENIEGAIGALCQHFVCVKLSGDLYLYRLRADALLIEYAVQSQRSAVAGRVENQLLGIHLFYLFVCWDDLTLVVHFDSNFNSHSSMFYVFAFAQSK